MELVPPGDQLIGPEVRGFGVMPIGEDSVARPNSANIETAVGVLDENIILGASVVSFVPIATVSLRLRVRVCGRWSLTHQKRSQD